MNKHKWDAALNGNPGIAEDRCEYFVCAKFHLVGLAETEQARRARYSPFQMLNAKTTIDHLEWSNSKWPLRASKDSNKKASAHALMFVFHQDGRFQW